MVIQSYSYIISPLIALAAVGVIILMCRWVFSTSHRDRRTALRQVRAASAGDFGLLVPVTTVPTVEDGEALRDVLRAHGIRGTLTRADGAVALLVFRAEEARARDLLVSG